MDTCITTVTFERPIFFSVVVPCYNEEKTLAPCIDKLLEIQDDMLSLEIIVVDDCSTDKSLQVAREIADRHKEVIVLHHEVNKGKGAALRTGFTHAKGEFVGIQDADLEYNPMELRELLQPLVGGQADVVYGSRYLIRHTRRVLYFWHSMMNRGLTFFSNIFTDLDLTDMETCYKLFRREVIQAVDIHEDRFGFEPEITAKITQMGCRVYEMPISYYGRTYAEGKKINWKDGVRALYCIFHYNAHQSPLPLQLLIYALIGGVAAVCNILSFMILEQLTGSIAGAAITAYFLAAALNYLLCIALLFRHQARWNTPVELLIYLLVVALIGGVDVTITTQLAHAGLPAFVAKALACAIVFLLNFAGRKYLVFPESKSFLGRR